MPTNTWKGTAARQAGPSHIKTGLSCQDYTVLKTHQHPGTGQQLLIAIVADGAGSSPEAAQGARRAAQTALRATRDQLWAIEDPGDQAVRQTLENAFLQAHNSVARLAALEGNPIGHYHTTLLLALHIGDLLATGHIGDGAIVAAADDEYLLVSPPHQGQYANETTFVTDANPGGNLRINLTHHGCWHSLALFSDGLQRLALDYTSAPDITPHQPFFRQLFQWLQKQNTTTAQARLESFLASQSITSRSQDDVSLAIAVRSQHNGPKPII